MWSFNRHNKPENQNNAISACPCCGSQEVVFDRHPGKKDVFRHQKEPDLPSYRCLKCGEKIYGNAPGYEIIEYHGVDGEPLVDDEEALRAAEAELKRQVEEADDRRCW